MSELDFCEDIVISAEIVLLLAITHFFFMPECRTLDLVISKIQISRTRFLSFEIYIQFAVILCVQKSPLSRTSEQIKRTMWSSESGFQCAPSVAQSGHNIPHRLRVPSSVASAIDGGVTTA